MPILNLKTAIAAPKASTSDATFSEVTTGTSNPPPIKSTVRVRVKSVCIANQTARFKMTPTTAAVMAVNAEDSARLPRSRSTNGAPAKIHRKQGTKVTQVVRIDPRALLQTWGTAARRHPVGGLGSIGEMLIEHNHGFGQGRGSNSECSFNQAHLPHDTWLQAPCLGLSFA